MKIVLTICLLLTAFAIRAQILNDKILEGFNIRNVGPAGMSGRITAIDVVLDEPEHIYIGSASGGVWESADGGVTWQPIFDDQPSLAIGAIKINQQNPSEIWVGTGEGNPRNSHNSGQGIFRTLDGGKTWKQMGLTETKTIHRILIDPNNPSTVFVGAHGNIWGPNAERGVFRSTDSGKTWNKVLFINDKTGIADMVMDPDNPRKIVAATWDYGRTPWDFYSGGPGSGIHITYDGGDTWKKITSDEGLPKGNLGRIGLAIAPSSPNIIYALVEAKENGLYKSTDGGEHWSLVTTKNIGNRPFYYHELYVDPQNENRLWNLYSYVSKSEDGGKTFETILDYGKGVHPDHHAFWIHPEDPSYIIDGNDGGLNISRDRGRNWYFAANIPVGQFYHIDIDHAYPYNIYGGMQDNGSWAGPAFVLKAGGIRNSDWRELYFGDGFDVIPKLSDTRYGWAMSQGGNLTYYDRETGFNQFVKPVRPDGVKLRFNWNAGIATVPGTDCGIYYGSQFVHRSDDCGASWTTISPDLTTNDTLKQKQSASGGLTIDATDAENHTTILCISPSTVDKNVIWVGTDDGNLQLTRDGGKTWTNHSKKITGFPEGAWVPQIEVSKKNAGEAFVVVNNYRRNDWNAYVFHTTDFGNTWKKITNDKEITSFVQAIVQDPVEPDVLFLGADDGLYLSIDKGNHWTRFPSKVFPRVSTMDLKIHPTDHSLAIGTFGRSIWVLDNILPFRELSNTNQLLEKPFVLFPSPEATQAAFRSVDGIRFTADAEFKGDNRAGPARFLVYVKPAEKKDSVSGYTKETVKSKVDKSQRKSRTTPTPETKPEEHGLSDMTVKAEQDSTLKKEEPQNKDLLKMYVLDGRDTIRYITKTLKEGWNDVSWDLRRKGVNFPSRREPEKDADDPGGVLVQPGVYKVVGMYKSYKDSTNVTVRLDPRLKVLAPDLMARNEMISKFYEVVSRAEKSFKALQDVRKDLKMVDAMMVNVPDSTQTKIKEKQKAITKKIDALEQKVMEPDDVKGITSVVNINDYIGNAQAYLNTSPGKPGQNAQAQLNLTQAEVTKLIAEVNDFLQKDWQEFHNYVTQMTWPLFKTIEKLE